MLDRNLREIFAPDDSAADRIVRVALRSRSSMGRHRRLAAAAAVLLLGVALFLVFGDDTPQTEWELVGQGSQIELRHAGKTVAAAEDPGRILILKRPGGDP